MFLPKKFILVNELTAKMGIHIANVSMLAKQFEHDGDFYNMRKLAGAMFINSKARKLPNNFKEGIAANEFTDMSNKLPVSYVREEYEVTEKELRQSGIITDIVKVQGKKMYLFADDFVKETTNRIGYVLDEKETMQCYEKGQIKGYRMLKKNKYFTWY